MLKYFLNPKKVFYMLKCFLGIFNFQLLYRTLKTFFYMVNSNFSYIQSFFAFLPQKDSYFNHDDTEDFFLFLPQKDFFICLEPFFVFLLFLLQKDFGTFHVLLFEAFLCLYLPFLYKSKTNL